MKCPNPLAQSQASSSVHECYTVLCNWLTALIVVKLRLSNFSSLLFKRPGMLLLCTASFFRNLPPFVKLSAHRHGLVECPFLCCPKPWLRLIAASIRLLRPYRRALRAFSRGEIATLHLTLALQDRHYQSCSGTVGASDGICLSHSKSSPVTRRVEGKSPQPPLI